MNVIGFFAGLAFGFLITGAGLSDYNVIHSALKFENLSIYLIMGSAVGTAVPLLFVLRRLGWKTPFGGALSLTRTPVERKHVLGAVIFGTGWAVAGTCPAPALAMIGGGTVLGIVVVAGLFTGLLLRDAVAGRAERVVAPRSTPEPEAA